MLRWLKNYKKSSKKLTYKNIKNFLEALIRRIKLRWDKDYLVLSQVYYRVTLADKGCLEVKMCPCYCDIPEKLFESMGCEKECYPKWMEKKEWVKYIRDNELDLYEIEKKAINLLTKYQLEI